MPLKNAQAVLKRLLPSDSYNSLYNKACNAYDVYVHIADWIWYRTPSTNQDISAIKTILKNISPYTMTSREGLIYTLVTTQGAIKENINGAFVECGVARGGISAMMAMMAEEEGKGRMTWLFDSFEGLPEQTEEDGIQKPVRHWDRKANDLAEGYCLGTWYDVSTTMFTVFHLSREVVELVKGWFQDTLPVYKNKIGDMAVLRLDGDWYESTKCCLENLYDNVVQGGFVIIDDYQLPGCKKAVDEYLHKRQEAPRMDFDANGRAYWRKNV